jgi:hypothetical protein
MAVASSQNRKAAQRVGGFSTDSASPAPTPAANTTSAYGPSTGPASATAAPTRLKDTGAGSVISSTSPGLVAGKKKPAGVSRRAEEGTCCSPKEIRGAPPSVLRGCRGPAPTPQGRDRTDCGTPFAAVLALPACGGSGHHSRSLTRDPGELRGEDRGRRDRTRTCNHPNGQPRGLSVGRSDRLSYPAENTKPPGIAPRGPAGRGLRPSHYAARW